MAQPNWRVDVHHHFYPDEYRQAMQKAAGGEGGAFPGVRDWTVARTLEEMDRNGVATSILSLSPPGCRMGDSESNRRLARLCWSRGGLGNRSLDPAVQPPGRPELIHRPMSTVYRPHKLRPAPPRSARCWNPSSLSGLPCSSSGPCCACVTRASMNSS